MKIRELKFRRIIIGSVILFYIAFIIVVYIIFNKVYLDNLYKNYKKEIMQYALIAKKNIEEEQLKMQREAKIAANESVTLKAFTDGIYSTVTEEDGRLVERSVAVEKLHFIKIANYLKGLLYGRKSVEQGIALYDEKGRLKGYSDSFSKSILISGDEKYIEECTKSREYLDNGAVDISTLEKRGNVFYIKAYAPIGKNSVFDFEKTKGIVVIGGAINQEFVSRIKDSINHEVIFIDKGMAYISSIYANDQIVKEQKIEIKIPEGIDNFYGEITLFNETYGFGFAAVKDYFGNTVAYVGAGEKIKDIKKIYAKSLGSVLAYGIIIAGALFLILYIMLRKIFNPFDEVFGAIEKIKDGNYERLKVKGYGELGILVKRVNKLSEDVEKRETELRELNQNLEKMVDERTFELQDVIEKLEKTKEELLIKEKMASIGKLAGGIAHEMNNPLSAILAGVQMMKIDMKSGNAEDCIDNMEIIESAAKKTREIVAKLQKYIERGNSIVTKFEIEDMIFKAVSMTEKEIKKEGIAIDIDICDGLTIKGNLVELTQVLVSLLMNSKDAVVSKNIKDGKITVKSFLRFNKIFITVEDNGTGIKDEDKLKIFDPFFTTKEVGKGIGLGLSLAYEVVKKNKGKITFESKYSVGTLFSIEFDHE